jgi:hypothetical protein
MPPRTSASVRQGATSCRASEHSRRQAGLAPGGQAAPRGRAQRLRFDTRRQVRGPPLADGARSRLRGRRLPLRRRARTPDPPGGRRCLTFLRGPIDPRPGAVHRRGHPSESAEASGQCRLATKAEPVGQRWPGPSGRPQGTVDNLAAGWTHPHRGVPKRESQLRPRGRGSRDEVGGEEQRQGTSPKCALRGG